MDWNGNWLNIGNVQASQDEPLRLNPDERAGHVYISGTTGSGKSRLIQSMVRQDILNWHESRCGMLLLDPHGEIYEGVVKWLANQKEDWKDILPPIITIDLTQKDWITFFNPFRQGVARELTASARLKVEALAHVWGQTDFSKNPTIKRWVEHALYVIEEQGFPPAMFEEAFLYNPELQSAIVRETGRQELVRDLDTLDSLRDREKFIELQGFINRFRAFNSAEITKTMMSAGTLSLDFNKAIDEGYIILVNASGTGGLTAEEDRRAVATLLLNELNQCVRIRGKVDNPKPKPFYVYIDEFQDFVFPVMARAFAQLRGFGIHITVANQFPKQIIHASEDYGEQIYREIRENCKTKICFQAIDNWNAEEMAGLVFTSEIDPHKIKHEIYNTVTTGYEIIKLRSESTSTTYGERNTITEIFGSSVTEYLENESSTESAISGSSSSSDVSETASSGEHESLAPIYEERLQSRQYYSLEEQKHQQAKIINTLPKRIFAFKSESGKPKIAMTPFTDVPEVSDEDKKDLLETFYGENDFCMPYGEAKKVVKIYSKGVEARLLESGSEVDDGMDRFLESK